MIGFLLALALTQAPAPSALADQAWQAIAERRAEDAERLFQQVTALAPGDARAWLGYAAAALLGARDHDARPRLERALSLAPAQTEAALLLSDLLYRQNRHGDALRVLERARSAGASAAPIDERIARLSAEQSLHAGFSQSLNPRFTLLFEGAPDEAIGAQILTRLDAAWARVGQTIFTVPGGPVTVTLYTEEQFSDITRAPAWAAGAFDGVIRVPVRGAVARAGELDRVLTHELAHAFVRAAAPRGVPMWLDEGLASVIEPRDLAWAREEVARAGKLLSPDRLVGSFRGFSAGDARLAYAQSALIVRALIDQHSAAAINALLDDLRRGVAFDRAFQSRMLQPFGAFLSRFAAQLGVPYDGGG